MQEQGSLLGSVPAKHWTRNRTAAELPYQFAGRIQDTGDSRHQGRRGILEGITNEKRPGVPEIERAFCGHRPGDDARKAAKKQWSKERLVGENRDYAPVVIRCVRGV